MNTYSVIMLGPRGSGKTMFLASMHKKLSTQGKLDFFLKVDGEEKRKYLNKINKELVFGKNGRAPHKFPNYRNGNLLVAYKQRIC